MNQIKLFIEYVNKFGFFYAAKKTIAFLFRKITYSKNLLFKINNTITAGILGEDCFVGPSIVQIDITNKCNNSCIGCWLHSPYFSKEQKEKLKVNDEIKRDKIIQTINELKEVGTQRILLSGGGEPLIHPNFEEIIETIRNNEMECNFITNFTIMSKRLIDKIIDLRVNEMFISLWASNAEMYIKTHPNQSKKIFEKIIDNIKYAVAKERKQINRPIIIILNTISKINYLDVVNMAKLASELGVNRVEFIPIEIIDNTTEHLKLTIKEIKKIKEQIKEIEDNSKNGFLMKVKDKQFTKEKGKTGLWGFDIFKKRILEFEEGKSIDSKIIDKIPCYVGWTYTRIMANGDVIPCCKAHKHPLGNINKQRFKDIWFSKNYNYFRNMAKNEKKSHKYFKKINCYQGCDNHTENFRWNERINKLNNKELKLISDIQKEYLFRRIKKRK